MTQPGTIRRDSPWLTRQDAPQRSGSLFVRTDSNGAETWYAKWYAAGGRQVKRRVGPKTGPGALSKQEAEQRLGILRADTGAAPADVDRLTLDAAGRRMIATLEANGRKRSTVLAYRSMLAVHLEPFFGDKPLDRITTDDVERFVQERHAARKSSKTILNALGLLHSIFTWAERRRVVIGNPCKRVDKPRAVRSDDIRFLDQDDVEALVRAVPDTAVGRVDRALYLAAAMTGLRQGELFGLRWRDVDWTGRRVRVRQAFVRGQMDTPKSRRGSRSVPLADRVAAELDRLHQASAWRTDDDLVFAMPETGRPPDRSDLHGRFKATARGGRPRRAFS